MEEQLIKESKELAKVIENEITWFKIFSLFEKLLKLDNKREIYLKVFPIISDLLTRAIQSDRSRLNGISLDCLKDIYSQCYKDFNFNHFLPILIKLNGKASKVFISRALDTIKAVSKYIEIKYIQKICSENIENVNKNIRFAIFSIIQIRYSESIDFFASLVEKGLKDPSQEVRTLCKEISNQTVEKPKVISEVSKNPILSLTPRKNFKVDEKHAEIKKLETEVIEITKKHIITKPLNNNFLEKLNQLKKERFAEEKLKSDELTPRKLDKYLEKFRNSTPIEFINKINNEKSTVNMNLLESSKSTLSKQIENKKTESNSNHYVSSALNKLSVSSNEGTPEKQVSMNSEIKNIPTKASEHIIESSSSIIKFQPDLLNVDYSNNFENSAKYDNYSTDLIKLDHNQIQHKAKNSLEMLPNQENDFEEINNSKLYSPFKVLTNDNNNFEEPFKVLDASVFEFKSNIDENKKIFSNACGSVAGNHCSVHSTGDLSFIHKVAEIDVINHHIKSENSIDSQAIEEYNDSLIFNNQDQCEESIQIADLSKSFASINIEASCIEPLQETILERSKIEITSEIQNSNSENNMQPKNQSNEIYGLIDEYCNNELDFVQNKPINFNKLKSNIKLMENSLNEIKNQSHPVETKCLNGEDKIENINHSKDDSTKIKSSGYMLENNLVSEKTQFQNDPDSNSYTDLQTLPNKNNHSDQNLIISETETVDVTDMQSRLLEELNYKSKFLENKNDLKSSLFIEQQNPTDAADETIILTSKFLNSEQNINVSFLNHTRDDHDLSEISFIKNDAEEQIQERTLIQEVDIASSIDNLDIEMPKRTSSIPLFNEEIFDSDNENISSKKSFLLQEKPSFNLDSKNI